MSVRGARKEAALNPRCPPSRPSSVPPLYRRPGREANVGPGVTPSGFGRANMVGGCMRRACGWMGHVPHTACRPAPSARYSSRPSRSSRSGPGCWLVVWASGGWMSWLVGWVGLLVSEWVGGLWWCGAGSGRRAAGRDARAHRGRMLRRPHDPAVCGPTPQKPRIR